MILSFFRMKKLEVLSILTFVFLTLILFTSASPAARVRKKHSKAPSLFYANRFGACFVLYFGQFLAIFLVIP